MTRGDLLPEIAAAMARETARGTVASYIPELACIDPDRFGIALASLDGGVFAAGEAAGAFSIQSVAKVFMLTLAMERLGEALWLRVGREPSGDPFNSIVQLEHECGVPRNPFINAGAIVLADVLLEGRTPDAAVEEVRAFAARVAGEPSIAVDAAVAASEAASGARNRALANFMAAEGNLRCPVEDVLSVYFRVCALAMSCRQLARAGLFLADAGRGAGGDLVAPPDRVRRINALMLTCGHYDASGEFAYSVGFPAKSGVGGGILAVVPGRASIAVWSPGLGPKGSSLLGTRALKMLSDATGWSVFGPLD